MLDEWGRIFSVPDKLRMPRARSSRENTAGGRQRNGRGRAMGLVMVRGVRGKIWVGGGSTWLGSAQERTSESKDSQDQTEGTEDPA